MLQHNKPTRRSLLQGAVAISAITLGVAPALATTNGSTDPTWMKLVADYRAKYSFWLDTSDGDDVEYDAFAAARAALPEPQAPSCLSKTDILEMTVAEIKAAGERPGHREAWDQYHRDHAVWKAELAAAREKILGPAEAREKAAYASYAAAFNKLSKYQVAALVDLREKIEIIAGDYVDCDVPQEYLADILADVSRLAMEGGRG